VEESEQAAFGEFSFADAFVFPPRGRDYDFDASFGEFVALG
jgi:hypothetical protein